MKARYRYRINPKPHQLEPLAKAFGTGRVVWNDALAVYKKAFIENKEKPKNVDKLVITQAKKTVERCWLSEVSVVHLQQSFRDLQLAWTNFFNSKQGKRRGKSVGCPKFKRNNLNKLSDLLKEVLLCIQSRSK